MRTRAAEHGTTASPTRRGQGGLDTASLVVTKAQSTLRYWFGPRAAAALDYAFVADNTASVTIGRTTVLVLVGPSAAQGRFFLPAYQPRPGTPTRLALDPTQVRPLLQRAGLTA